MEHKLIKTEKYLLVVSDEFKNNIFGFHLKSQEILLLKGVGEKSSEIHHDKGWNKKGEVLFITAHKPLNGEDYLDGVDVLPSFSRHQEDDINRFTDEFYKIRTKNDLVIDSDKELFLKVGFKTGYLKAKETYKYTEDDVFRMFLFGHSLNEAIKRGVIEDKPVGEIFNDRIQFINQPKVPIAFESEEYGIGNDEDGRPVIEPRKITNLEGRVEWVGTYKF